jgi:hypothetical protein
LPDESLQRPIEPRTEYGKPEPAASQPQAEAKPEPKSDTSSLAAQIAAMRAQQEQHQQQAQQQIDPLAMSLASIPGLTIPKFHFLYHYFAQRPHLFNSDHWGLLRAAHDITLGHGVKEDSAEYFAAMDALLRQHAAMPQQQSAPAAAPAPPIPEPAPPHVAHVDVSTEQEPEMMPMAQNVAAPVSRGDHGHSIEPEQSPSQVRLSPEERDMAQRLKLSEVEYAAGKLKLAKMKRSKLISE